MAKNAKTSKKNREAQARAARLRAEKRKARTKVVAVLAAIAIALSTIGAIALSATNKNSNSASNTTTTIASTTPCPATDGSAERRIQFETPPPVCIDKDKKYTATFDTTEGKVVVALDTKNTPVTANNFIVLARYKYYDGTQMFRTDQSIDIIQGGSPHTQGATDPGPGYTINDEAKGFSYKAGDLVMARTQAANSSGGQYFFGAGPNVSKLDSQGTYLNFGSTTEGLDVLQKILGLSVPNQENPDMGGVPSRTVTVNKVTINES